MNIFGWSIHFVLNIFGWSIHVLNIFGWSIHFDPKLHFFSFRLKAGLISRERESEKIRNVRFFGRMAYGSKIFWTKCPAVCILHTLSFKNFAWLRLFIQQIAGFCCCVLRNNQNRSFCYKKIKSFVNKKHKCVVCITFWLFGSNIHIHIDSEMSNANANTNTVTTYITYNKCTFQLHEVVCFTNYFQCSM